MFRLESTVFSKKMMADPVRPRRWLAVRRYAAGMDSVAALVKTIPALGNVIDPLVWIVLASRYLVVQCCENSVRLSEEAWSSSSWKN